MRLSTKIFIVSTIVSVLVGVLAYLRLAPSFITFFILGSPLYVLAARSVGDIIIRFAKKQSEKLENILQAGRPLPARDVRPIAFLLEVVAVAVIIAYIIMYSIGYTTIEIARIEIGIVMLSSLIVIYVYVRPWIIASTRASREEDELTYLLSYMRAVSESHVTPYELILNIKHLKSVPYWAREISFAEKIAHLFRSTIFDALRVVAQFHPSKKISEIIHRIVVMAESRGDIRSLLDRLLNNISEKYFANILTLYEKMSILLGTTVLILSILPITVATVAPLSGGGSVESMITRFFVITLFTTGVLFLILHVTVPPSLVFQPNRTDKTVFAVTTVLSLVIMLTSYTYRLDIYQTCITLTLISIPASIYAIKRISVIKKYNKLISTVNDVVEVTSYLGENISTKLEEMSKEQHGWMRKALKLLSMSAIQPKILRPLIDSAPTKVHMNYIEAFRDVVKFGSKLSAFLALSKIYENILNFVKRVESISTMFEIIIIITALMNGFFTGLMSNIFLAFSRALREVLEKSTAAGFIPPMLRSFIITPETVFLVYFVGLVTVYILSLMSSKGRYGTIVYGYKIAPLLYILYIIGIAASLFFIPKTI